MKRRLLSKLATALHKATDRMYPKPTVLGPDRGSPGTTLLWEEGPYEWTNVSLGSSVYSGELGRYGDPVEPAIAAVVSEIEAAGYFLEPSNHYEMALGKV